MRSMPSRDSDAVVDMRQALVESRVFAIPRKENWPSKAPRYVVVEDLKSFDARGGPVGWYVDRWGQKHEACYPNAIPVRRSTLARIPPASAATLARINAPSMLLGEVVGDCRADSGPATFAARFDLLTRRLHWCDGLSDGDGEPLLNLRHPHSAATLRCLRFVADATEWQRNALPGFEVPLTAWRELDLHRDEGLALLVATSHYPISHRAVDPLQLTVVAAPDALRELGTESGFAKSAGRWMHASVGRKQGQIEMLFAADQGQGHLCAPYIVRGTRITDKIERERQLGTSELRHTASEPSIEIE